MYSTASDSLRYFLHYEIMTSVACFLRIRYDRLRPMKRHRQKILIILCFMLSFGSRAFIVTDCKKYIPFLFNRHKLTELKLQTETDRFQDNYIRGLEQARAHIRLAHKLRTEPIDPWKTHIEEFATMVEPHLDYIERGIRSQDSADKLERLAILEDFRAETQSWIEKEEVSYRRWVNLNFRLSILATPTDQRTEVFFSRHDFLLELHVSGDWVTNERLESAYLKGTKRTKSKEKSFVEMLNQFPEIIIAPQMDGITGIMALSRMTARKVYLHALVNNAVNVHGFQYPDWIFLHDNAHVAIHDSHLMKWVRERGHGRSYEEMVLPFHDAFLLHIQKLPIRKREILELIYYHMVFEYPEKGYALGQEYKYLKYPRSLLMRSVIDNPLTSRLLLSSFQKGTLIPDWVEPKNLDDVKIFLAKAMSLYDNTAREVFNSL